MLIRFYSRYVHLLFLTCMLFFYGLWGVPIQAQPACSLIENGWLIEGSGVDGGDLGRNMEIPGWFCSHGSPNGFWANARDDWENGNLNAWVSPNGNQGEGFYTEVDLVQGHVYAFHMELTSHRGYSDNQLSHLEVRIRDNTDGFGNCQSTSGPTPPRVGQLILDERAIPPAPQDTTRLTHLRTFCFTFQGETGRQLIWFLPLPENPGMQSHTNLAMQRMELVNQTTADPLSISAESTTFCQEDSLWLSYADCSVSGAEYRWIHAETGAQLGGADTLWVQPHEAGTYWLVRNIGADCADTAAITLAEQAAAGISGQTHICHPDSGTRLWAAAGADSYLWNTHETTAEITVSQPGTYWVEMHYDAGCVLHDTIEVTRTTFALEVAEPAALCEGSTGTLLEANPGAASYLWSDGSTLTGMLATAPGTYWVRATDTLGCVHEDSVEVVDSQRPSLHFDITPSSCLDSANGGIQIHMPTADAADYIWLWADDPTAPFARNALRAGSYALLLTDTHGCTYRYETQVEAANCCIYYNIPNVFTPNGDGVNDFLVTRFFCISHFELLIHNRWGELVYATTDADKPWNGTYNGRPSPAGVYFCILKLYLYDGNTLTRSLPVTLLR